MSQTTQVDQRSYPLNPKGQQFTPLDQEVISRLDLILCELRKLNFMFQMVCKLENSIDAKTFLTGEK